MSYGSRKRGLWPRVVDLLRLPSSSAYNVEPVTNTSSSWVLDACRRSSRLCLSHYATRTVDNTVDLHAAKPDIRPESFFCLPHLHSTPPLGGFLSEYRHPIWYEKTRMAWLPDGEKISKICLFFFTWSTNVTDGQDGLTDIQTLHDGIGRAYA